MVTDTSLFKLNIPTKIYYGRIILSESLTDFFNKYGKQADHIMIVTTGRSLIRLGHLDRLTDTVKKVSNSNKIIIYDGISANPKLSEIEEGVNKAKREVVDLIIGFGGGSAMDAAKAIAAGALSEIGIIELFRNGIEPKQSLPVIAIPTTSGTGSELSKAAILSDDEMTRKGGIRGECLYPTAAITDSYFTETVPFNTTMETGFDVLAHAIESYVSKAASPYTEMLSEYVMKEAGMSIKKLINDLNNTEARKKMSFCSMIMGINLGNASTALPHRMQYPLGAHTDSSHGAGLAVLYPVWMKYEEKYATDKIHRVLDLLSVTEIDELLRSMGIYRKLSEIGVEGNMISILANEVSGNINNDPAASEQDIIKKIYEETL